MYGVFWIQMNAASKPESSMCSVEAGLLWFLFQGYDLGRSHRTDLPHE